MLNGIGRTVCCVERGTVKTSMGIEVNSTRLAIIAHQFISKLDVLFSILTCCRRNLSNCERCSELNKDTKHTLTSSKPSNVYVVVIRIKY